MSRAEMAGYCCVAFSTALGLIYLAVMPLLRWTLGMRVRAIIMGRPSGNPGKSPYAPSDKVVNGKQCHFLEAGWGGTIRTAFEDCKNVTFKRVGGPSPITVYHPPSHEAGCAGGSPFLYGNGTSGMEPGQDQGAGMSCEQVAQTPTSPATVGRVPLLQLASLALWGV